MSQRQRSLRLSLVFERLSKRKRAAKLAAEQARSAEKLADRQQDQARPEPAANKETKH